MVLGLEVVALLRQVLDRDGLLLRELLRECVAVRDVVRDKIALRLPDVATRAMAAAEAAHFAPPVIAEGKKFVRLLHKTAAKRGSASRAPGVLEHRTSPRLEWLTDFGALTKHGRPRNAFEYSVTDDASLLLSLLDDTPQGVRWSDTVALSYWRQASMWSTARATLPHFDLRDALLAGYRVMQRSVGPTSIRDACLVAGVLAPALSLAAEDIEAALIEWASSESRITVSGGRYSRQPELVHISPDLASGA